MGKMSKNARGDFFDFTLYKTPKFNRSSKSLTFKRLKMQKTKNLKGRTAKRQPYKSLQNAH